MPSGLFVPSPLHVASPPRVDEARDVHDVLAAVTLQPISRGSRETKLVIGLDEGRVIRVVEMPADLGHRARAQLAAYEAKRPWQTIRADELYVFDVQAVEKQPDAPGADDPLFLYGILRGPYPAGLQSGVSGIEGQLAATRGELLDGLSLGIQRSFTYEAGRCGTSCVHAALPIDPKDDAGSVVLAFPLVPMGDDGSNELVAAQVICDVLGAMRADLGDDLANDPVAVPSRAQYERELTAAGWTIKGDVAVHTGGKGRLASLFAPSKKQKLPREIAVLGEYVAMIDQQLARLPGWPAPARARLHARLGIATPRPRPPTNPGAGAPPSTSAGPSKWLCPYCGAQIMTAATECGTCGRPLPQDPWRTQGTAAPRTQSQFASPPPPPPPPAAMTRPCPFCGASAAIDASACGTCGRPLPPVTRAKPPTRPPAEPRRNRPPTPSGGAPAPRSRPPTPPPFVPRNRPPTPPPIPQKRKTGPRTVMPGLTAPTPKEWIRQLIDDHSPPDRPRSRVVVPGRNTNVNVPDWMLDMIETEFPDDDNDK